MDSITIENIIRWSRGLSVGNGPKSPITRITLDSRTAQAGTLFVALPGTKDHGVNFVEAALQAGAAAAMVPESELGKLKDIGPLIVVPDCAAALTLIAAGLRASFKQPILALSGSVGKTTTRELIKAVLSANYRVGGTKGNQNNELGVPLTLLNLDPSCQWLVIEIGQDHPGDLGPLMQLVKPHMGLLTNVSWSHAENFTSLQAIADSKGEVFRSLPAYGIAYVNCDDPLALEQARRSGRRIVGFGFAPRPEGLGRYLQGTQKPWQVSWEGSAPVPIANLELWGSYNRINALAALAVGCSHGIRLAAAARALANYQIPALRSQHYQLGGINFIVDCYNSNPLSCQAALTELGAIDSGRRVAIVGDMLELGQFSQKLHQELGHLAAALTLDNLYTFGEQMKFATTAAQNGGVIVENYNRHTPAVCHTMALELSKILHAGDTVLIKGSRSMHLEEIFAELQTIYAGAK